MVHRIFKYKRWIALGILLAYFISTLLTSTLIVAAEENDESNSDEEKVIYTVANAHLDTVWNWDVKRTINSYLPKTFNHNFELFEKYPDYKFNFEGAFRYALIKEYYPEAYEKIKDYVEEGRWNVSGSSWDAGDVNIPSPEAVMRNILYGNKYFEKEFGKTSVDIFLPDCFGFGYTLPTIAAHMGLKGFSTQKLTWGSAYGIPFDIGNWVGVDGSSIVAALNPGSYVHNYNSSLSAPGSEWVRRVYENGDKYGVYVAYSYHGDGDTGGGPSDRSVQIVQEDINKGADPATGVKVKSATTDELFRDLTPEQIDKLPVYNGELLMTTHAVGGYTSRAISKRWNRHNELLGDATERTSVLADWLGGTPYPKERLTEAWKRVIWHQFHDDLPGTSLPSAYLMTYNDYIISLNQFAEELTNGVGAVASVMNTKTDGVPLVVYNPLSKDRQDVVTATVTFDENTEDLHAVKVFGPDGKEVPSQVQEIQYNEVTVSFLADVPSVGYKVYDVRPSNEPSKLDTGLKVNGKTLENQYLKVTIDDNGDIASIYDKENDKELLSEPIRLELFDNNSSTWPSWEILYEDILEPREVVKATPTIEVVEDGPVSVAINVVRKYAGSTYDQTIRLSTNSRRVDVDNIVNWQNRSTLLKVAFPLTVSNEKATYDLGLGTIERGINTEKLYEVPAQQWADITDESGEYGVSIINDCKYGWDKPEDNILRLTLIHTPRGSYGSNNQHLQDLGENRFQFSIYGHKGDWVAGDTVTQGERVNQPLRVFQSEKHDGALGKEFSFLTIDNPHVTVKAIKQAEDSEDIIVRVVETSGKNHLNVKLNIGHGIAEAVEVNGYEDKIGDAIVEGGKLVFDINRYEPKTFKIKLKDAGIYPGESKFKAIDLPYNKDVVSFDDNRSDGALDEKGNTIPAELLPDVITSKGINFYMGPKEDGKENAVVAQGQQIEIPSGYDKVYFLATSTGGDLTEKFGVNDETVEITIQDYMEYVGGWDDYGARSFLGIKRDPIAWNATHTHTPSGNSPYDLIYLFRYEIDLPDNGETTTITLPQNEQILIFAMTAVDTPNDGVKTAAEMYDEKEPQETYEVKVLNGTGSGLYPAGATVSISAVFPVGLMFKEWIGDVEFEDPYAMNTTFTMPNRDVTIDANFVVLGPNLALNKPTDASGQVGDHEGHHLAVDGRRDTKWCDNRSPEKWLVVDLEEETTFDTWIVRHAGDGGETSGWNTRDFRLQISDDKETWVDVDVVRDNKDNVTYRVLDEPVTTRYVRLFVDQGEQGGRTARIYEFELYSSEEYEDAVKLTVENGTGSGPYAPGDEAFITADVPIGYVFKKWIGPVKDPYAVHTSVVMTDEDVTVKATFVKADNLALNKPAEAIGQCNEEETAAHAVDGDRSTKWCNYDRPMWLKVDLLEEYTIGSWVVRHAVDGDDPRGDRPEWNTRDFRLQVSNDGEIWEDVDIVKGNTANITYRRLEEPVKARYVKLYIDDPTNTSSNKGARIFEFEIYAAVDKSALEETVAIAEDKNEAAYTAESWAVFADALEAAKEVLNDEYAAQVEVDEAFDRLISAMEALVKIPVDKSELEKAIEEADKKDYSAYTEESWAAFVEALDAAKAVLADKEATQEEVDAVLAALLEAEKALVEREPGEVNKYELKKAVEAAEQKDPSAYTEESWDAFAEALEAAKAVLADEEATQEEVDAALAALQEAEKALVEKSDEKEPEKVDKSVLEKAVREAEKKKSADYTLESWMPFAKALDKAKAVLADKDATQEEVDRALKGLEDAIAKLVKITEPSEEPKGKDTKPQDKVDDKQLPGTATSNYNFLLAGFVTLAASIVIFLTKRKRDQRF